MKRDFHYCCIAVLARKAGYSNEESEKIAYSSQYVDDATERQHVKIGKVKFEPVRTAHLIKFYNWKVQRNIYMPFHFLPPSTIKTDDDSFIVEPGGVLANKLLDAALAETDDVWRPYRLGVALHTFADTWAHQGFSGRLDAENNVINIKLKDSSGEWVRPKKLKRVASPAAPQVGHAEALEYPDLPYQIWECERPGLKSFEWKNPRDNTKIFLEAARVIFERLAKVNGKNDSDVDEAWRKLGPRLRELFVGRGDTDTRCARWHEEFSIEPYTLRKSEGAIDAWDARDPTEFERNTGRSFWSSSWVLFHRAALTQRNFVLQHVSKFH